MKIVYGLIWTITILFNGIAAQGTLLGGTTTGAVSDFYTQQYGLLFVPAGYVFAIWGFIYGAWLVTIVRYLLDRSGNGKQIMKKILPWFAAVSLLNGAWLVFWQLKIIPVTIIIMVLILLALIKLYLIVMSDKDGAKYNLRLSTGIYLGWISVATIANASVFLSTIGWTRFGLDTETWTIAMMVIAAAIGIAIVIRKNDYTILAVLIWAFIGIAMNKLINSNTVDLAAYAISIILALFALIRINFRLFDKKSKK